METTPEEIQKRQETIDGVRQMLDFLEANPSVRIPNRLAQCEIWFFGDKEGFLKTVQAFGSFSKEIREKDFRVTKHFGPVTLTAEISRENVCTKKTVKKLVDVDEWDCIPLLSQAEIQEIGQEAAVS